VVAHLARPYRVEPLTLRLATAGDVGQRVLIVEQRVELLGSSLEHRSNHLAVGRDDSSLVSSGWHGRGFMARGR